jgi:branched-chain amino acid aminotransferase
MRYRFSDAELTDAIRNLILEQGLRECYVRPVVLTGEGKLGVRPADNEINVYIAVWSWGAYLGPGALENGVRVTVVKQEKYRPKALDPTVKAVGHYLNSVRATVEAHSRGFDEGLMLNHHGRIAEGSGENLFLVRDGKLTTNPWEESLLPGVTRDSILKIAEDQGIGTRIAPITLEDLKSADEAFFTGTAAEVTPIRELDGVPVGAGTRGPITARMQESYLAAVRGRLPGFESWLTPVS